VLALILKQNPDVITLEELDHFDEFEKELGKLGYAGCFKPQAIFRKGGLNPSAAENGGFPDGVAIFWNTTKLHLVGGCCSKPERSEDGTTCTNIGERVHDYFKQINMEFRYANGKAGKQVALAVHLKNKAGKIFAVVAAHMKSGSKPADLPDKKAQALEIAKLINQLQDAKHDGSPQALKDLKMKGHVPVVFGCDFNSDPETKAFRAFKAAQGGGPVDEAPDVGKDDEKCALEEDAAGADDGARKDTEAKLVSSYKVFSGKTGGRYAKGKELDVSTGKFRIGGPQLDKLGITYQTIDFIFAPHYWKCTSVLSVPSYEEILETSPQLLPSGKYPSDHLMIGVDLEMAVWKYPELFHS